MSQAQKTLMTLLALVAITGGLGWFAYSGVYKKDEAETEKKNYDNRLFAAEQRGEKTADGGIPNAEFVKVTVVAKGETTVLEREPGKEWRITSPVTAPADKVAVDALVSQLQTAKFKSTVQDSPSDAQLEEYGLKPPTFSVTATATVGDGKTPRTVKLEGGTENTFNGTVFMRRDGEQTVFAAEGGARWALEKTTFDLRQKELVTVDEAKVQAIEVKTKVNAYRLERDDKKNWQLKKPFEFPADATVVNSMLSGIKGERAQNFRPYSGPADLKPLALDVPAVDATLTLEGGEKVRLRVGLPNIDAGSQAFTLVEGGGQTTLAEVVRTIGSHFDRNPLDLRDKTVLPFKTEDAARLSFGLAGGTELVIQKSTPDAGGDAAAWRVVSPKEGPAKVVKLTSVLWALSSLKATTLGDQNPKDWAKYGIDNKSRSVTVSDGTGNVIASLKLGKPVPSQPNLLYARGTRNQVVEIDTARLSELPTRLEDVLDVPAPPDAGAIVETGAADAGSTGAVGGSP